MPVPLSSWPPTISEEASPDTHFGVVVMSPEVKAVADEPFTITGRYRLRVVFLACILLGLGLRILAIDRESFWIDETHTANTVALSYASIIKAGSDDQHPRLYFLLLKTWSLVFGNSEVSLRSFSVVVGMLLLIALYSLSTALFGPRAAVAALVLGAVSWPLIRYSVEARMYILFWLLMVLSFRWYFHSGARHARLGWLLYVVFTISMLYTHLFGVFILGAQILESLYVWLKKPDSRVVASTHLKLQALVLLLYAPQMVVIHHEWGVVATNGFWIPPPTLHALIRAVSNYLPFYTYNVPYYYVAPISLLMAFLLAAGYFKLPSARTNRFVSFFLLTVVLTTTASCLGSFVVTPFFYGRYLLFNAVLVLLCLSFFVSLLQRDNRMAMLLAVYIITAVSFDIFEMQQPVKEDWRGAMKFVSENMLPGDFIKMGYDQPGPGFSLNPALYYLGRYGHGEMSGSITDNNEELMKRETSVKRVWFIWREDWEENPVLHRAHALILERDFFKIHLSLFELH